MFAFAKFTWIWMQTNNFESYLAANRAHISYSPWIILNPIMIYNLLANYLDLKGALPSIVHVPVCQMTIMKHA